MIVTLTVAPASTVPVIVDGGNFLGDGIGSMDMDGGIVSTVIPTAVDGGDVFPAASVAFAVMLWAPSASDDDVIDQVVRLSRGMDPIEVEPSNITIEVSATFVPFIVGVDVVTVVPLAGLVIAGDSGDAVSSVKVVNADPVLPAVSVASTKTK